MRTLLVLICSLALAFAATGAQEEKKKEAKPAPKKPAQATQVAKPKASGPKAGGPHQQTNASQRGNEAAKGKGKRPNQTNAGAEQPTSGGPQKIKEKKGTQSPSTAAGQGAAGGQAPGKTKQGKANVAQAKSKPIKPHHFNVPKQPNTAKAPPVKFQQGKRIEGSQNWQGKQYCCFPQLQIGVARSELVAQPSQPHRIRVRRSVFLERGLLVSCLGLLSQRVLRMGWSYLRL
jgi:hypothetical protein